MSYCFALMKIFNKRTLRRLLPETQRALLKQPNNITATSRYVPEKNLLLSVKIEINKTGCQ